MASERELRIIWERIKYRQGSYADRPMKYAEFAAWHQSAVAETLKDLLKHAETFTHYIGNGKFKAVTADTIGERLAQLQQQNNHTKGGSLDDKR